MGEAERRAERVAGAGQGTGQLGATAADQERALPGGERGGDGGADRRRAVASTSALATSPSPGRAPRRGCAPRGRPRRGRRAPRAGELTQGRRARARCRRSRRPNRGARRSSPSHPRPRDCQTRWPMAKRRKNSGVGVAREGADRPLHRSGGQRPGAARNAQPGDDREDRRGAGEPRGLARGRLGTARGGPFRAAGGVVGGRRAAARGPEDAARPLPDGDAETRAWVRRTIAGHLERHIPELAG